jgi:hypothetical protein
MLGVKWIYVAYGSDQWWFFEYGSEVRVSYTAVNIPVSRVAQSV